MGVAASSPLSADIKAIQKWKWTQVMASIKTYNENEFPFGITTTNIVTMTGMSEAEAKQLVQLLSKQPDTGVVNSLKVLSALLCLGDVASGSVDARIEILFDLVDFDGTAQVTHDELVILFLSCGTALAGIQGAAAGATATTTPDDAMCRRLVGQLYQELEMPTSDRLAKNDFTAWAISFLSELQEINIDNVYASLYH